MARKMVAPLKETSNAAILDAIRNSSSLDYQQRIPSASKGSVAATARALNEYNPKMNEFLDGLVNRIGLVLAKNTMWENPLKVFKRGLLEHGDTIEEIMVGLLEAYQYDPDRDYMEQAIFGQETVETQVNFHQVNRRDMYKITVNEPLLMNAFLANDGISQFIASLLAAPLTSDQWDEFLLTCQLFSEYERNGGFYHVNVPDVRSWDSDGADSRMALRKVRAMSERLKFVSRDYNAAKMPVFAKADDLVLFTTPEFKAAIDVEALAGAFNVDRMDVPTRIVTIPEENFNIDGAQAILTTEDFFVIADQRIDTRAVENPAGLYSNHFLHHWQVVSASRFVPSVLFHTGADDEVIRIQTPVTGISSVVATGPDGETTTTVTQGQIYQVDAEAVTTPAGGVNSAVRWSVEGNNSSRTYVTNSGVLHVSTTETAASIKVHAFTTWINPENPRDDVKTASATLTVTGKPVISWPRAGQVARIAVKDVDVPAFAAATLTYTLPVPKPYTKDDVEVFTAGPGTSKVSVNAAGDQVKVTFDGGEGAPVVYTLNAPAA